MDPLGGEQIQAVYYVKASSILSHSYILLRSLKVSDDVSDLKNFLYKLWVSLRVYSPSALFDTRLQTNCQCTVVTSNQILE